ncbi:MAG TPA: type VI secretion system accessory protein TagJ [Acetobacteraceae bacterium]|nr:type VI secretion system accessory protein TagJ [Acetobacteraceae bacterium]
MTALELLRTGEARAALEQLKQEVRKSPRDVALRTFLFQMFCVFGEWERAVTQLTTAAELDALALPMAQAYRAAIRCELLRGRVFAGARTPTVFADPEPWMSLLIEANRGFAAGKLAEAARLRDDAFEQAPSVSGSIDGQDFEWIADADPRLGPMLEAVVDGKYYWVPFHRIRTLDIEPPADLRDQVWMPAHFLWTNGGESYGFIPTRYPGSELAADATLALARRTEWQENGEWFLGLGQRMLTTDAADFALMDIRRIAFRAPDDAAG